MSRDLTFRQEAALLAVADGTAAEAHAASLPSLRDRGLIQRVPAAAGATTAWDLTDAGLAELHRIQLRQRTGGTP